MNWHTAKETPTMHTDIVVVYRQGEQLLVHVGKLMTITDYPDVGTVWTVCAGIRLTEYIRAGDIVGWVRQTHLCTNAEAEVSKKNVTVKCKWCGQHVNVIANAIHLDRMDMPVIQYTEEDKRCYLDWDSLDAECEFEYICENCENVLAHDLESLNKLVNKQKVKTFYDDGDKILDLLLLSKEEFLKSYSYLTEEEYDATVEELRNTVKQVK
jgi:hypothetical protein